MQRRLILVLALLVGGCGGAPEPPPGAPTASGPPPLAREPKAGGEIVVTGEASPASHGPYDFSGEYTVRFEQHAPEDPKLDFGDATSFVAALDREAEITAGDSIPLFEASRARQSRKLEIDGRYYVDVSFGDYPYAIRFTPVDG
jgi:hypothetical protein